MGWSCYKMKKTVINMFCYIVFFGLSLCTGPQTIYLIQNASLLKNSSTGIAKNHYLNPANLENIDSYISFSNNSAIYDLDGQKVSLLNNLDGTNFLFSFESLNSSSIPIYGDSASDENPEGYFDSYWYAFEYAQNVNLSSYFNKFKNIAFGFKIEGSMYKMFTAKSSNYSFSFGFSKALTKQLELGLVINNLGMKNRGNSVDQFSGLYDGSAELGVGINYLTPNELFDFVADVRLRNNILLGKFSINTRFPVFNLSFGSTQYDNYKDFCYGFSLDLNNWKIFYGYLSYGYNDQKPLGNPNAIELTRKF